MCGSTGVGAEQIARVRILFHLSRSDELNGEDRYA
jgi:hypothetical protein